MDFSPEDRDCQCQPDIISPAALVQTYFAQVGLGGGQGSQETRRNEFCSDSYSFTDIALFLLCSSDIEFMLQSLSDVVPKGILQTSVL